MSSKSEWFQIHEVPSSEGHTGLVVELPVEPFGSAGFSATSEPGDYEMLKNLCLHWAAVWPEMRALLEDCITGLGLPPEENPVNPAEDRFEGLVSLLSPPSVPGNHSKIFVRLDFNKPPVFDFVLQGQEIFGFQPVF